MKKNILQHIFSFFIFSLFTIPLLLAQNNGTGLQFNDEKYSKVPLKATLTTRDYSDIDSKASLKAYCPIPGHQGSYSTCVGWSTAYAARTIVEARQKDLTDKEEITKNAFSGAYVYKLIKNSWDSTCAYGTYINEALDVMIEKGVPKYTVYHPLCPAESEITKDVEEVAQGFKIDSYHKLFEASNEKDFKVRATKKAIAAGHPIIIGLKCAPSFYNAKGFWTPTEDESPDNEYGGHAVCVIGYDDKKYEDEGAFEIMNSWGTQWGNEGFIWVKYSDFADYVKYAYEMIEMPDNTAKDYDISGVLKLKEETGTEMPTQFVKQEKGVAYYKMNAAYSSGTKFRIYITNNQPAFVYLMGTDLSQQIDILFPHKKEISAALNYESSNVALPNEDYFIQLDDKEGTDYLGIIYAKEALDIQAIQKQMEKLSGTFFEKLQTALNGKLVTSENVHFKKDKMEFEAKSQGKSLTVMMLEFKHLK
jgi:hypothetical protein